MKLQYRIIVAIIFGLISYKGSSQDRYWLGTSTYQNNFTDSTDLGEWTMVEDNGTGSWTLSGNGTCILQMDDSAGAYAVRIFNEIGGNANKLILDSVSGIVEFEVVALTGGTQQFFLQVQEFSAADVYLGEQTILSLQDTTGYFSVDFSTKTWDPLTTKIRFMFGGENYSGQQGTIELNYFNYNNNNQNWSNSANWSATSAGSGGASPPGIGNNAIFDGALGHNGICFLDAPVTIDNLIFSGYNGSLDLGGNDLTISNAVNFTTGNITNSLPTTGSIVLNCTDSVSFESAIFSATITGFASNVFLNNSIFNYKFDMEKNGPGTDVSSGGNVFNDTTVLRINNASGTLRLAGSIGDRFNKSTTFISTSGEIEPAYNDTTIFQDAVTVNSLTSITFGAGNGSILFSGNNNQTFNNSGTASPVVQRLIMNKTADSLVLNTTVMVGDSATFISGIINTTPAAILEFRDNATFSGANNSSYVEGPVKKTGNDGFLFPVGNNGIYRPIAVSAPGSDTDEFTGRYFNTAQSFGTDKDSTLLSTSTCEYWTIDGSSTSNVYVTLNWQTPDCSGSYVTDPSIIRVAHWNGTSWEDYGNNGTTGDELQGTVTSAVGAKTFSPLIMATSVGTPLPIELYDFWAVEEHNVVTLQWQTLTENENDHFTLERSESATNFKPIGVVKAAGYSNTARYYSYKDELPEAGYAYYRLKQTDYDGKSTCFKVVYVQKAPDNNSFLAFPNPSVNGIFYLNQQADVLVLNYLQQPVLKLQGVQSIDLSGFPKGIYVIRNQKNQSIRVVVQ